MERYTVQNSYGVNESLVPLQQHRPVCLVALVVDPNGRCLVVKNKLPSQIEGGLGACHYKSMLPFATKVVNDWFKLSQKHIHQNAPTYDPYPQGGLKQPVYLVVRIDVHNSPLVENGEWVMSPRRVLKLDGDDQMISSCISLHLHGHPAWQMAEAINVQQAMAA